MFEKSVWRGETRTSKSFPKHGSPEGIVLNIVKINITTSQSVYLYYFQSCKAFEFQEVPGTCCILSLSVPKWKLLFRLSPPGTGHTRAHKLRGRPANPASRKRRQVKTKDSGGGGGDKCATQNSRVTKQRWFFTLLHGIDSVCFCFASQIRNKCGVHCLIVDLALNRSSFLFALFLYWSAALFSSTFLLSLLLLRFYT